MRKLNISTLIKAAVLALVVILSFTLLANKFTNPETYKGIIEYLDAKKNVVTNLAGSSAAASAAITLLPGDVGTSIANSLATLSTKFLTVLVALYLEKYLLTIIAMVVFKMIIPASCVLLILYVLKGTKWMLDIGVKFSILGIALMLMVPCGVKTSQMVEDIYGASIKETIDNATDGAGEIVKSDEVIVEESKAPSTNKNNSSNKGSFTDTLANIYTSIQEIAASVKESATNVVSNVTDYAGSVPEKVTTLLNKFIEATAVMIITSCAIPLLVVWLFFFIIKLLFGINIDYSNALPKIECKQKIALNNSDDIWPN